MKDVQGGQDASFALSEQHVLRQTAETTFVRSEQADAVEAAYAGSTEGG